MLERFRVQVGDGHVGQKLDALNTDDVALGDRRKAKKKQEIYSLRCELDLNINWEEWDFGACENCFQYKSEAELNIDGFVSFYPFFSLCIE